MESDQSVLLKVTNGYRFARRQSHSSAGPPVIAGESHPGQCLAGFAESGVSLTHRFPLKHDSCYVADLLSDAAWSISTQEELEWRIVALALYRPHIMQWRNKFGETLDWPKITRILLTSLETMKAGGAWSPCFGTHSLYALAVLDRVNDQTELWDASLSSEVHNTFRSMSLLLEQTQGPDGSWNRDWLHPENSPRLQVGSDTQRLLITGHQLEWLALCPASERPSQNVLTRAGDFVCRSLASRSSGEILSTICPCSHGLRAYLVAGVRFVPATDGKGKE
jgi:hypothetical protein